MIPGLLCATASLSCGQSYSELAGTQLEARKWGAVATGDLNNDGYVDIVTTGIDNIQELSTTIYINNHDGTFAKLDVGGLTPMYNSKISLGDYDDDGFFDILLSGEGYDPMCVLWRNNGDLTFSLVDTGLEPLGGYNSAEWRDVDNDGDVDALTSGMIRNPDDSYSSDLRIYNNVGEGQFQRQELAFTSYANVGTFGDYDNDGDLDLLSGGTWMEIYPNRGDGTFSTPRALSIPLPIGQIKWFDQNGDGNLDFIVSGRGLGADEYFTDVYVNSGAAEVSFTRLSGNSFPTAMRQNIDVRDHNGDGRPDVLFTGMVDIATNEFVTSIYTNEGDSFIKDTNVNLPQLGGGDVAWFDLENDGDLDILMTGELVAGANVPKAIIMRNEAGSNTFTPNTPPSPPQDLQWHYNAESGTSLLTWSAGTDTETPVEGLSYNVAIGSSPATTDILSPEAKLETGRRLINRIGNAEMNLHKPLAGLSDGIYYFQVQTIDGTLVGSAFTAPVQFFVGIPTTPSHATAEISDVNKVVVSWQDNSTNELGFVVEARSHLDAAFAPIDQVGTDTTSLALGVLSNGTYTFRIKAINPNGESAYIATAAVAVGVPEVPPALDIELDGDEVHLSWQDTPNEVSYILERSVDGAPFEVIATLERDVTTFSDSPPSGLCQYRLKTNNLNGESAYIASAEQLVVSVGDLSGVDPSVTFFPNPARGHLWIQGQSDLLERARFMLYSSRGQIIPVVRSGSVLDLQGALQGIYMLKVIVGNQVATHKILIE